MDAARSAPRMNTGWDKEKHMRRSFRTATIFTGAGALAGAFGPLAFAAPAGAAAAAPATIKNQECLANNGGISNWVHLYYPNNDHPAECFHGAGATGAKATIASFCPGNNSGWIAGFVNSVNEPFHYKAGQGRKSIDHYQPIAELGAYDVWNVSISRWTRNAKCLG